MAVIHRPSPHKFIQQAYKEANREANCATKPSSSSATTLPALPLQHAHVHAPGRCPNHPNGHPHAHIHGRPQGPFPGHPHAHLQGHVHHHGHHPYARPHRCPHHPNGHPHAHIHGNPFIYPHGRPVPSPQLPPVQGPFPDPIGGKDFLGDPTEGKNPEQLSVPYNAQSKRQVAMALVDLCTTYMESVWPQDHPSRLPLRRFVFEILRRSRVQYPVFQVALCYIARLGPLVKLYQQRMKAIPHLLGCSRRVLVAALQVASKFLQDKSFSTSIWARISGLPVQDLRRNEIAFMQALDWKLFVSYDLYMSSCRRLRIHMDPAVLNAAVHDAPPTPAAPTPAAAPAPVAVPAQQAGSLAAQASSMLTPDNSPISASINAPPSPEVEIWSMNS